MNKKKLNIFLKIGILTLLIILGTVGSVNANYIDLGEGSDSGSGMHGNGWNPVSSSETYGTVVEADNVGFDTLEDNNQVFCDEHGKELSNEKKGKPTAYELSWNPGTTRYFYDTQETCIGSPEEIYIFAHIPGGTISHGSRETQWAWWAHGRAKRLKGSGSMGSVFLGAVDFGNSIYSFNELYNSKNVLGVLTYNQNYNQSYNSTYDQNNNSTYNQNNNTTLTYDQNVAKDNYERIVFYISHYDKNLVDDLNNLNLDKKCLDYINTDSNFAKRDANGDIVTDEEGNIVIEGNLVSAFANKDIDSLSSFTDEQKDKLKKVQELIKTARKDFLSPYEELEDFISECNSSIQERFKALDLDDTCKDYVDSLSSYIVLTSKNINDLNSNVYSAEQKENLDKLKKLILEALVSVIPTNASGGTNNVIPGNPDKGTKDKDYPSNGYSSQFPTLPSGIDYEKSISDGGDLLSKARAFEEYANKFLVTGSTDGRLKDEYKPYIDVSRVETYFDSTRNQWIVGPLNITYPYYQGFADLTGIDLKAKKKDGTEVSINFQFLDANLNVIQEGVPEPTITNSDVEKNKFYIAVNFNQDLEKITHFGISAQWMTYFGGTYNFYADGSFDNYVKASEEFSIVDGTPTGKVTYVRQSQSEDAQDLVELIEKVVLRYAMGGYEVDIPTTPTISIVKEVVDENGNKVDTDDTFYYQVAIADGYNISGLTKKVQIDGKDAYIYVDTSEIKANSSVDVILPSYTGATMPDYYVIEVDQFGEPWSENPKAGSIWEKYTPKNYGVAINEGIVANITNIVNEESGNIGVEKRIRSDENSGIPAYARIKLKDGVGALYDQYYVKLLPEHLNPNEVKEEVALAEITKTNVGTIKKWTETDSNGIEYDVVYFESNPVYWVGLTPMFEVDEVDQWDKTYAEWNDAKNSGNYSNEEIELSIWNIFSEPSLIYEDSQLLKADKTQNVRITNKLNPIKIDLELCKVNPNLNYTGEKVKVDVSLIRFDENGDGNKEEALGTVDLETNLDAPVKKSYTDININSDDHLVLLKLKENDENLSSKLVEVTDKMQGTIIEVDEKENEYQAALENMNSWVVKRNSDGTIKWLLRYVNTQESRLNDFSLELKNEDITKFYTGLKIEKSFIEVQEGTVKYPDELYFKVTAKTDDKEVSKNIINTIFGDSSEICGKSEDETTIILKLEKDENNQYIYSTGVREYFDEIGPILDVEEVDQYFEPYSEKPQEGSIWEKYKPLDGSVEKQLYVSENPDEIQAILENGDEKCIVPFENVEKFSIDNPLDLSKTVVNKDGKEATWEEGVEFYFVVEPLDSTLSTLGCENNKEFYKKYFNIEPKKVGNELAIVFTKDNRTAKSAKMEWTSNQIAPKFRIYEVDQNGDMWSEVDGSKTIESLFNEYRPSNTVKVNGEKVPTLHAGADLPIDFAELDEYGNPISYEYEFENSGNGSPKKIKIKKVITNDIGKEINDKFYFRIWEKDEDITTKYFKDESKLTEINGNKYIVVTKDSEAISTEEIRGDHELVVVEYDSKGISWDDGYANYNSDQKKNYKKDANAFWEVRYIPFNKKTGKISGKWKVNVSSESDETIPIDATNAMLINLQVAKEIIGTNVDEKETFDFEYHILSQGKENAIPGFDGTTNKLWVLKDGKFEETTKFEGTSKVSKSSPWTCTLAWVGDSPVVNVAEKISDKKGYILKGYKYNNGNIETANKYFTIDSEATEKTKNGKYVCNFVMVNEKTDDVTLQITKTTDKPLDKPQTFVFEVYTDFENELNYTLDENDEPVYALESIVEGSKQASRFGKNEGAYTVLEVPIAAGETSNTVTLKFKDIAESEELYFKVVEVDSAKAENVSWAEYKNGESSKFWSNWTPKVDKDSSDKTPGVWERTVKKGEKGNIEINAKNEKNERNISIIFNKYVMNLDTNTVDTEFADNEKFYFDIEYTSNLGKDGTDVSIYNKENYIIGDIDEAEGKLEIVENYSETLKVRKDEKITVTITEHDGEGRTYNTWVTEGKPESDVWTNFTPATYNKDNNEYEVAKEDDVDAGIKVVEDLKNGEDATIVLNGYNFVEKKSTLKLTKIVPNDKNALTRDDYNFYFKVKENGKDKTLDLFGTEWVNINKENATEGVSSIIEITGKHNYEVYEYDAIDGITYTEYKKLSDKAAYTGAWGSSYIMDESKLNKNGAYPVTIDASKGKSGEITAEIINFRVIKASVVKEITGKNVVDADKDEKFPVEVIIEGKGNIFVKNSKGTFDKYDKKYITTVEVSANSKAEINGIAWDSQETPKMTVKEDLSKKKDWKFVGYSKNNGKELSLDDKNPTEIIVTNTKEGKISLQIRKDLVDFDGNPTPTLSEDTTYYFEVYLDSEREMNSVLVDGKAEDLTALNSENHFGRGIKENGEEYSGYIIVPVTVPAGEHSSNTVTIETNLADDEWLDYKVVEIDYILEYDDNNKIINEQRISYSDYLADNTKSEFFKYTKPLDDKGYVEGRLDKDNTVFTFEAKNIIRNIDFNFYKEVYDENGKLVESKENAYVDSEGKVVKVTENTNIDKLTEVTNVHGLEKGETFYFTIEYSYNGKVIEEKTKEIEIGLASGQYIDYNEIIENLPLDGDYNVKVTEHDIAGNKYSGFDATSDVWDKFTPTDEGNDGIIEKTVVGNTNMNISLVGKNKKIKQNTLTLNKKTENFKGEFYFRVFENGTDVTAKSLYKDVKDGKGESVLDDKGRLVINEDRYLAGGVTSNKIRGKHTFTVIEYDENDVTYEQFSKGEKDSEFWKKYKPENNGKIVIEFDSADKNAVVKEFKNNEIFTDIEVKKEIVVENPTSEDTSHKFKAEIKVSPRTENDVKTTIKFVNEKGIEISEDTLKKTGSFDSDGAYIFPVEVSADKSAKFPYGIYWDGPNPVVTFTEKLGDNEKDWKLKGYVVNGKEDSEPTNNNSVVLDFAKISSIETKIVNEKPTKPTDIPLTINKILVDKEGKEITITDSYTANFEVYLKGDLSKITSYKIDDKSYNTLTLVKDIKENKPKNADSEDNAYIHIAVPVEKGKSTGSKTINFKVKENANIEYKVVEVDEKGYRYEKRDDSDGEFWKISEPQDKDKQGITTGKLENGKVANINAKNVILPTEIPFEFKKIIKKSDDEEGTPVYPYFFKIKYDSNIDAHDKVIENYEINESQLNYTDTIELQPNEKVKITVTEYDSSDLNNRRTYNEYLEAKKRDNTLTSKIWDRYIPTDNGVWEVTLTPKSTESEAIVVLTGTNKEKDIKDYYGKLSITKHVIDAYGTNLDNDPEQKEKEFYFTVVDSTNTNVVNKLFSNYFKTTKTEPVKLNDGTDALVVHAGETIESDVKTWKSKVTPTYVIREVDKDNKTYEAYNTTPVDQRSKSSMWYADQYVPSIKGDETKKLKSTTDEKNVPVTEYSITNKIKPNTYRFELTKTVDGKPIEKGENFYFQISDDKEALLDKNALLELFDGLKEENIYEIKDKDENVKEYAIHFYKTDDVTFDHAKTLEIIPETDKYYIIEVDQYGARKKDEHKEGSIWNEYNVLDEDGIWEASEQQPKLDIDNQKSQESANLTIKKTLKKGQTSDEEFKFKVYVDGKEYGEEIILKAGKASKPIEISWNKFTEKAPNITVKEIGHNPTKVTVNGEDVTKHFVNLKEDEVPKYQKVAENGDKFVFNFENDVEEIGHILITKELDTNDWATTAEKYKFAYRYLKEDGTIIDSGEVEVAPGQTVATKDVKWSQGNNPTFEVEEIGYTPTEVEIYNIVKNEENKDEKVSLTNTNDYNVDSETKIASGPVTSSSDPTVVVKATNGGNYVSGEIELYKVFEITEKISQESLFKQLKKSYEFNFNLTIKSPNNGIIKVNGEEIKGVFNKTYTLRIDNESGEVSVNGNVVPYADIYQIFAPIKVEWMENADKTNAPTFSITENSPDNKFWTGKFITASGKDKNYSGTTLREGEKITVTFKNYYDIIQQETWTLVTKLAGIVWEDVDEANKQNRKNISGGSNGIYDSEIDILKDGVVVRPVKIYYKPNGEILRGYNGEPSPIDKSEILRFLVSDQEFTSTSNGSWHFDNVSVPALTEKEVAKLEQDGENLKAWSVRYDIEFYYDGINYEPAEVLASGSGDEVQRVNEYIQEPSEKFYNNSMAKDDPTKRNEFNSNYDVLENVMKMQPNGESKGKLGNAIVEYKADVQYVTPTDDNFVISSGDIKLDINGNNYEEIGMCASTYNAGIGYFLGKDKFDEPGDMLIKLSENRTVELDAVYYTTISEYRIIYDYCTHINLGLRRRKQADISTDKDLVGGTIIINEKAQVYKFTTQGNDLVIDMDSRIDANIKAEIEKMSQKANQQNHELNIYTSDYNYRAAEVYAGTTLKSKYEEFLNAIYEYGTESDVNDLIKSNELQIYLTYRIDITNNSDLYDVYVYTLDDYSESTLEYVDVSKAYWADKNGQTKEDYEAGLYAYIGEKNADGTPKLSNVFEKQKDSWIANSIRTEQIGSTKEEATIEHKVTHKDGSYDVEQHTFNKSVIEVNQKVTVKEPLTYFMTYRVSDYEKVKPGEFVLGTKRNIAEVSKMMALDKDGNPAGVIDGNSAPGNYNLSQETYNLIENDTDYGDAQLKLKADEIRSISGGAGLEDTNAPDGAYKLTGITTKLVETRDIPEVDEEGKVTNRYNEYEFYWNENDFTATDENGAYNFDSNVISGTRTDGLVAGNYEIRFFYGDNNKTIIQGASNTELPRINGVDYKTTSYTNATKSADYIDNEWHNEDDDFNNNESRDNEGRRLQIIEKTQVLDNNKTRIFDIADYADENAYIDDKIKDYKDVFTDSSLDESIKKAEFRTDYDKLASELFVSPSYKNGEEAYNGIVDSAGYTMFADTAKINLKADNPNNVEDSTINSENSASEYNVLGMNLGLKERAKTNIYLDKQIKEFTVTEVSGEVLMHVTYDIDYFAEGDLIPDEKIGEIANIDPNVINKYKDIYRANSNFRIATRDDKYYVVNKIADGLYVSVRENETEYLEGIENLQALNDYVVASDGIIMNTGNIEKQAVVIKPGFRYINTDSDKFNSGRLDIKYQFTAINLSEEDYYGDGLYNIMYDENGKKLSEKDIKNNFNNAIEIMKSNHYVINDEGNRLKFAKGVSDEDYENAEFKKYGEYLGHNYYEGNVNVDADHTVKTTIHQIVDYLDNDATIVNDSSELADENRERWDTRKNSYEELKDVIDERVFIDNENNEQVIGAPVTNKTLAYKDNNIAITRESNETLIKELSPAHEFNSEGKIKLNEDNYASTTLNVQTLYSSANKSEAGIDNFAEILLIENDVGRRDLTTVYGNYDPRAGASYTTERDETSSETITLSPPTGNKENEKEMMTVAMVVAIIALASGGLANLKLNFFSKRNKNKKD